MLCQRRTWVLALFAIGAFFPLIIVWNTFLDIGNALPELFRGSPDEPEDDDDATFVRKATALEFPSPIDYAPIREVCTRNPSNFRPGLLFSCEGQHGGIGMLRNQMLKCIRYTIHGGGALVIPSMAYRNPGNISDIETATEKPLEYLLDREAFKRHLTKGCPGLRLFDRAQDFPSYDQLEGKPLDLLGDQFEPDRPPDSALQHPREWRRHFDEWLGRQGVSVRAERPVHIKMGQSFLEYPVKDDGDGFVHEFGKILSFRRDIRALSARILLALRRRFDLPIDPAEAISKGAYFGAHLRLEADAVWAWPPDEGWRFSRMQDQFDEHTRAIAESGLGIVYVASGNQTVVDLFADHLGAKRLPGRGIPGGGGAKTRRNPASGPGPRRIRGREVTVVTKRDLLTGDDLAMLESLTFDQQALVDFLVMFKASSFMGVASSSFPWTVALRRHELSRYPGYANEGSDLLKDEYSTIMGMRRDYPSIDPFATAMWP